jgi:hypothetical protein
MSEYDSIIVNNRIIGSGINLILNVRVVSINNLDTSLNLNGVVVDGVTLVVDDLILLAGQTDPIDNGVYTIKSGAGNSLRSPDLIVGDRFDKKFLSVTEGTTYGNTTWHVITTGVVDTDAMTWKQTSIHDYSAGDMFYADTNGTLAKLSAPATDSFLQITPGGVFSWIDKNDVAAGLDPKENVQWGTLADLAGTYASGGGTGGTGEITGVDLTNAALVDFTTAVQIGDRILVKDQTDAKQNGIYVVTTAGAAGVIERASDHDGSPQNEVSGGNYVFITGGSTLLNSGWILQGQGNLALNVDDLNWSQFNAATTFTAGDGIDIGGNIISVDLKANGGLVIESTELAVDLGATNITGTLAVGDGGTGVTSITAGHLLLGNGTSALNTLAPVARKVLRVNGAGAYELSNIVNLSTIHGASDDLDVLKIGSVASAVKEFTITNSVALGDPKFSVTSSTEANVSMELETKGTGSFNLKTTTSDAQLNLFDAGGNFVGLRAGALTSDVTFTLPIADGANDGDLLKTDAAGQLSFVTQDSILKPNIMVTTGNTQATNTNYRNAGRVSYDVSRFGSGVSCQFFFYATITGSNLDFRVRDEIGATTLLEVTNIAGSGFKSLAFTAPTSDTVLQIQIRKTTGANPRPVVSAIHLQVRI